MTQVLEFYDRQGDFGDENVENLDRNIARINMIEGNDELLVKFLLALTDERVLNEEGPFDHPELFVPNGHPGDNIELECVWDDQSEACDRFLRVPAVGKNGRSAIGLAPIGTFMDLAP